MAGSWKRSGICIYPGIESSVTFQVSRYKKQRMLAILSGHRVVLPVLDMRLTYNTGLLGARPDQASKTVCCTWSVQKIAKRRKIGKSSQRGEKKTSATFLGGGFPRRSTRCAGIDTQIFYCMYHSVRGRTRKPGNHIVLITREEKPISSPYHWLQERHNAQARRISNAAESRAALGDIANQGKSTEGKKKSPDHQLHLPGKIKGPVND